MMGADTRPATCIGASHVWITCDNAHDHIDEHVRHHLQGLGLGFKTDYLKLNSTKKGILRANGVLGNGVILVKLQLPHSRALRR